MAEFNFFQSIFCKDGANKYEVDTVYDNTNESEEKVVNIVENDDDLSDFFNTAPSIEDNISLDFSNKLKFDETDAKTSIMGAKLVDENEYRTVNMEKTPEVSGFIFDDIDENDGKSFSFNKAVENKSIEDVDNSAVELIEKLKNDGIEKERMLQEKKNKEIELKSKDVKVESEIDMPLL